MPETVETDEHLRPNLYSYNVQTVRSKSSGDISISQLNSQPEETCPGESLASWLS